MRATLLAATLLCAVLATAEEDVQSFYPKAAARIGAPPEVRSLSIVCQKKIDETFVSFIAADGKHPIIAAFTKAKFSDPARKISFKPLFITNPPCPPSHVGPCSRLSIKNGEVEDWGYIFDRNGDGMVDYLTFVIGPAAVETDTPPPAEYAKRGKEGQREYMHWVIDNMAILYTHQACDKYDGQVNAIITEEYATDAQWVDHRVMVRLLADGKLQASRFKRDITQPSAPPEPAAAHVSVHGPGIHNPELTAASFEQVTPMITLINRAAAQCNFGAGTIPAQ